MQLYTFWRSQAAFRVRIALTLKGLEPEMLYVDLIKGEQAAPLYRKLNPAMLLPALVDGAGPPLVQSLAIIEYLEEVYPNPPLLPEHPRDRAHVRAIAHTVAIDAHPFVVPRVRNYLKENSMRMNLAKSVGFNTGSTPHSASLRRCSPKTHVPVSSVSATLQV